MVGSVRSRLKALACSEEDLVTLSAVNRALREQVVSLLLEFAVLREQAEAQTAGVQMLRRLQVRGRA
jgi:hypothetical protein